MTDDGDPVAGPAADLPPELVGLLARSDIWDPVPHALEDAVVAAIAAEVATQAPVADLDRARERRATRGGALPWWLAAAAAIAVVAAGVLVVTRSGDDDGAAQVAAELSGTELAPQATASAVFESSPAGLKVLLDTTGLPGAGDGEMYEAWIGDGEIRISAGSFHLRGGDQPIMLWAGSADPRFRIISVTLEPIDGVAESSGQVVLRGEMDLAPLAP